MSVIEQEVKSLFFIIPINIAKTILYLSNEELENIKNFLTQDNKKEFVKNILDIAEPNKEYIEKIRNSKNILKIIRYLQLKNMSIKQFMDEFEIDKKEYYLYSKLSGEHKEIFKKLPEDIRYLLFYTSNNEILDYLEREKDINKIVIFLRNIKEQISSSFEEPKKIKKILELDPRKQKKTAEQEKKKYLDKIDLINNFYEKVDQQQTTQEAVKSPKKCQKKKMMIL